MSRKQTSVNHSHPKHQLKDHVQRMYAQYRACSTADLTKFVKLVLDRQQAEADAASIVIDMRQPVTRKQMLDFLCEEAERKFKAEWQRRYGWPYEDALDRSKLMQHQADHHAAVLGGTKEPLVTDQMIREADAFALEKGTKEAEEQAQHLRNVVAILASGFAGVDSNGVVVDRRHRGIFAPLPRNEALGTPDPVEVTDAMRVDFEWRRNSTIAEEAKTLPPTDMKRIISKQGREYTREQFDALPRVEQDEIRIHRGHLIQVLCASGYAGTLGDGMIVDRRVEPTAIPMAKNSKFNCPEPKEVLPPALQAVNDVMQAVGQASGTTYPDGTPV